MSTFPNDKFAEAMGLGPNDMIDYESPAYNGFVAGVEAGRAEATPKRIRTKERPPEPGQIIKGWDHNGAVVVINFNGDPKMANCDWWMPLPK